MAHKAKPARKTVTVERYPIIGRQGHMLQLMRGGNALRNIIQGHIEFLEVLDMGADSRKEILIKAHKMGFTHVKYDGVWPKQSKPKGGKITLKIGQP